MKYRAYLHNGQVTDRVDSTVGEEFSTPVEVSIAEVAEALGVPVEEITALESYTPPEPPQVVIPPQVTVADKREHAIAAVRAIDLAALPDDATRTAVATIQAAVLGEPTLDAEGVWAQHLERRSPDRTSSEKPWK